MSVSDSQPSDPLLELVVAAKPRQADDFTVARALPSISRRSVGPFVFFDHLGPTTLPPNRGLDVRPHPHIHLATVTYLFDGEILHRDSLGFVQSIRPGAINWMTAGRGIVHSERTSPEFRAQGPSLHGVQLWIALPKEHEDIEPSFVHHEASSIPELRNPVTSEGEVVLRILAGSAFGHTSPVAILSPMFYVEVVFAAGAKLLVPNDYEERAVYVVSGDISCGSTALAPRDLAILKPGATVPLTSASGGRVMLLGGAALDGPRYIWWNFVSSSKERIVQAARAWRAGEFPLVPGDEEEFIPLNDEPHFVD